MSHLSSTGLSINQVDWPQGDSSDSGGSAATRVPAKSSWTPEGVPTALAKLDDLQIKFPDSKTLATLRRNFVKFPNIYYPEALSTIDLLDSKYKAMNLDASTFDSEKADPTPVPATRYPRPTLQGDKPSLPRKPKSISTGNDRQSALEQSEAQRKEDLEERRQMKKEISESRAHQKKMDDILQQLALTTRELSDNMRGDKPNPRTPSPLPRQSSRRSQEVKVEKFLGKDTGPSWEAWLQSIKGKLRINNDHFDNEEARMLCVFTHTSDKAQEYLLPCYADDADERFARAEDMLEYLATVFGNAFKQRDAIAELNRVKQGDWELFSTFQGRFIKLVQEARVPINAELTTRLYDKLTPTLRIHALSRYSPGTPYQTFVENVQFVDAEVRRVAQDVRRSGPRPAAATNALTSKPSILSPTPFPARQQVRFAHPQPASAFPVRPLTPDSRRPSTPDPRPAQKSRLDQVEKRCFGCHETGHIFKDCPNPRKLRVAELEQLEYMLANCDVEDEHEGDQPENY